MERKGAKPQKKKKQQSNEPAEWSSTEPLKEDFLTKNKDQGSRQNQKKQTGVKIKLVRERRKILRNPEKRREGRRMGNEIQRRSFHGVENDPVPKSQRPQK